MNADHEGIEFLESLEGYSNLGVCSDCILCGVDVTRDDLFNGDHGVIVLARPSAKAKLTVALCGYCNPRMKSSEALREICNRRAGNLAEAVFDAYEAAMEETSH